MKKVQSKGFTLVELMVTLSIIVMLVAVALPTLKFYKEKAMAAQLINVGGRIASGLETYYNHSGNYTNVTLASPEGGSIMADSVFTGVVAPYISGVSYDIQAFGYFICIRICREFSIGGFPIYIQCVTLYSIIRYDPLTNFEVGFDRVIDTGPEDRYGFNMGTPPSGGLASPDVFTP